MSNNVAISGNNANSLTLFGGRGHNLFNTPTKPRLFSNSMLKLSGLFLLVFVSFTVKTSSPFARNLVLLWRGGIKALCYLAQACKGKAVMIGFKLLDVVTQNALKDCSVMPSIITNNTPQAYGFSFAKLMLKSRGCFILGLYRLSTSFTRAVMPLTKPKPAGPQATVQATVQATPQATMQATMQAGSVEEQLLAFCLTPKSRADIQEHLGLKNRDYFRKEILNPLLDSGQLLRTLPDKPTSPKQQFYTAPATNAQGTQ